VDLQENRLRDVLGPVRGPCQDARPSRSRDDRPEHFEESIHVAPTANARGLGELL
jgi:hypothetical protein